MFISAQSVVRPRRHGIAIRQGRIALLSTILSAAVVACQDSPAEPPGVAVAIRVVDGDGQRGASGTTLPRPLVVEVVDARGRRVPGATVAFEAEDGGRVDPAAAVTDASGRASTTWTLGRAPLGASAPRARARLVLGGATDPAATFSAFRAISTPLRPGELRSLAVATYDGSGQVVHPDVLPLHASGASSIGDFLLAITPYPFGNAAFENPSVFAGDGVGWSIPAGVSNPLAHPERGHLSDPDIVLDPASGRLMLYYREASDRNRIWLIESADAVRWSAPLLVAEGPNHAILSPSVVRRGENDWWMWAVDGEAGCSADRASLVVRRSSDGRRWSAPQRSQLVQPGFSPWHVEVQWIAARGEYWALYNAKTPGSCTTPALFLATSTDGVNWTTYPTPVLVRGAYPALADIVYRASLHFDESSDIVTIWHSGARFDGNRYVWGGVVDARTRQSLFALVATPGKSVIPPGTPGAPPLAHFP